MDQAMSQKRAGELVVEYAKMIRWIARKWVNRMPPGRYEVDDFAQIATVYVLKGWKYYVEGFEPRAWVAVRSHNGIKKFLRNEFHEMRDRRRQQRYNEEFPRASRAMRPIDILIQRETVREILERGIGCVKRNFIVRTASVVLTGDGVEVLNRVASAPTRREQIEQSKIVNTVKRAERAKAKAARQAERDAYWATYSRQTREVKMAKKAAYIKAKRAEFTPEEQEAWKAAQRERVAKLRANMTPEQKAEAARKVSEYQKRKREERRAELVAC